MLETHSTKATAVGKSNNARVWGRSPQPPEANGGSGADPSTLQRILQLLQKYAFLGIFWLKFLLKTAFFNGWIKCVDAPLGAFPHLLPLIRHWVCRLKAMTNCPNYRTVCSFRHFRPHNLRYSYCNLFGLNHQCFQLLMRDRAHSTFAIRVVLLYLFFESWNCWIYTVISLSKYIQLDMNWWISYNSNLANFMSSNFMTHKPKGIAQLFQMTKK